MTCRRADEIDFVAFLLGEDDPALRTFRAHLETCADCSAVVQGWQALDRALETEGLQDESLALHPPAQELEHFALGGRLEPARQQAIATHVADCAACATELRLIDAFDASALAAATAPSPSAAKAPADAEARPSPFDLVGWISIGAKALRENPGLWGGLAAAAAAALLVLWAFGPDSGSIPKEPNLPSIVDRGAPPSAPAPEDVAPDRVQEERPRVSEIAVRPTEPPAEEPDTSAPTPDPPSTTPRTEQLATIEEPDAITPPAEAPPAPAPVEREEGVVLLAALTTMPDVAMGTSMERAWASPFDTIRAGGDRPLIEALAPATFVGRSTRAAPRLWWSLSEASPHAIEVLVVDEEGIDPAVALELPGPHDPGRSFVDLEALGATLAPGRVFSWTVTLLVDPANPARNPTAGGAIEVVALDPANEAALGEGEPHEAGHRFAEAGFWYDAHDFFASLALEHPEAEAPARQRDRLEAIARNPTPSMTTKPGSGTTESR